MRAGVGLVAGLAGRKTFGAVWSTLDDRSPPQPEQRAAALAKLALALSLEGAVFRLFKGLADHAARRLFLHVTGRWPGAASQPGREASD